MRKIKVVDYEGDNASDAVANITNYFPMDADISVEVISPEQPITFVLTIGDDIELPEFIKNLQLSEYGVTEMS